MNLFALIHVLDDSDEKEKEKNDLEEITKGKNGKYRSFCPIQQIPEKDRRIERERERIKDDSILNIYLNMCVFILFVLSQSNHVKQFRL